MTDDLRLEAERIVPLFQELVREFEAEHGTSQTLAAMTAMVVSYFGDPNAMSDEGFHFLVSRLKEVRARNKRQEELN